MTKLPHKVNTYIRVHFENPFITNVTELKTEGGHVTHVVDLDSNDNSWHLEFNNEGDLVSSQVKPVFEDDFYDGEFYGNDENAD